MPHREICVRTYLENFQNPKNMVLKQTAIKICKALKKNKECKSQQQKTETTKRKPGTSTTK